MAGLFLCVFFTLESNKNMSPFEAFLSAKRISTDTRNIIPGSVFFALKGARFNGNDFALQALEQGARYAVIDEEVASNDPRLVRVDDVLKALQDCARSYRRQLGIPIIGLTGSNGKTTNKELFHAVLSKKYRVHATKGNFNNHIGVPLTLLAIPENAELAVVEMGANHQGEIAELARICEPNVAYITNFGKAHLEGFGGVEGIIKGKSELYDYMRAAKDSGLILLNADDPIQVDKSAQCHQHYSFGTRKADVLWRPLVRGEFAAIVFEFENQEYNVQSQLSGYFNQQNIAAAVALGLHFEVEPDAIVEAIEEYTPSMNRVEWRTTPNNRVLLDAYNANPTSMALSLESFAKWHKDGLVVLGDMFELGDASKQEHEAIVQLVESLGLGEQCILVGDHFGRCAWSGLHFAHVAELANYWEEKGAPKDASILLKGSRGIALERLMDQL